MHPNSVFLFERWARPYFQPGLRVLEIGPDGPPSTYRSLVGEHPLTWHTLDIQENPRCTYSSSPPYDFPIEDGEYDVVFSGQVFEHVPRIWTWMRELARVCKIGGFVITINPVSWPYHEYPVDCWRAFPEGMTALYEDSSLEVVLSEWGSFEAQGFRRYLPGRSPEAQNSKLRTAFRILGRVGFPVERAYDAITIGRKSASPAEASERP